MNSFPFLVQSLLSGDQTNIVITRFNQNYESGKIWYYAGGSAIIIIIILFLFITRKTRCPYCSEKVKKSAKKCKHCGERIKQKKDKLVEVAESGKIEAKKIAENDLNKIIKTLISKKAVNKATEFKNQGLDWNEIQKKLGFNDDEFESLKAIMIYKGIVPEDKDFKHKRFSLLYQEYQKKVPKPKQEEIEQLEDNDNLNNKNVINEYRTVDGNTFRYINLLPQADVSNKCYKCQKTYKGVAYNCPNCGEPFWHTYEEYVEYVNNQ